MIPPSVAVLPLVRARGIVTAAAKAGPSQKVSSSSCMPDFQGHAVSTSSIEKVQLDVQQLGQGWFAPFSCKDTQDKHFCKKTNT